MEEEYSHYKKTVDNISKGIAVPNIPVVVTRLPKFNIEELDGAYVEIFPRTIQKIMAGYLEEEGLLPANYSHAHKHYVSLDDVLALPDILKNPAGIAPTELSYHDNKPISVNGFMFLSTRFENKPLKSGGFRQDPLAVILHIKKKKGEKMHVVVSSYGLRDIQYKRAMFNLMYRDEEQLKTLKDSMLALQRFNPLHQKCLDEGAPIQPSEANSAGWIPSRHVPESGGSLTDRPPLSKEDINKMVEDWQVDDKEERKALVLFVAEQYEPEEGEEILNTKGIFVEAITLMQIKNALRDEMKTQLYDELVKDKEQGIGGRE